MASQDPHKRPSLYPQVDLSNPDSTSPLISNPNPATASSSLYPSVDMDDLVKNLFTDPSAANPNPYSSSAPPEPEPIVETIITIPGAVVHLIDKQYSVELALGDFSVFRIRQGDTIVAVLARVGDEVQWPLLKDEAAVKVDDSHYFFSLRPPMEGTGFDSSDEEDGAGKGKGKGKGNAKGGGEEELLNYGLSFASKGQEKLLKELDGVLEDYSNFSVQKVSEKSKEGVLDGTMAKEMSPEDLKSAGKKAAMEETCTAYWTMLAPNVEDYSGTAAKFIAAGSGKLIRGILWCGDVTVERLKWGDEVLKRRMSPSEKAKISPETMKRIRRVKMVSKMTEKVANGVLSGVVKVSGFFTSKFANSKAGKKFFSLLPGEIVLASLDGFSKICDAAEVAGRNVMSTSSTVTTGLVSHRYGEDAGKATNDGLGAAGHAIGTAWAVFKIRKALNPKSAVKSSSLAKSAVKAAAAEYKSKKASK
ncbi:Senescence-associated protein [Dionaea muscipula]